MEVTAGMVMDLRKKTGLPMMECKKALTEASGDADQAMELLRQRGLKKFAERSENETKEGRVVIHRDDDSGRVGIVALGCETDPVAGTEDFMKLATAAAKIAARLDDPTAAAIREESADGHKFGELLDEVFNRLREKLEVVAAGNGNGHVGTYVHHNGKVGVLVEFNRDCPDDLKTDVCMHVAAMKPEHLNREQVDPAEVERERQSAREEVKGKPENIIDKIVDGKLSRWYSGFVLLEQPFVKDDKKSIQQALKEVAPDLTIQKYLRFQIG